MQTSWQVEVEVLPHVTDAVGRGVEGNLGWLGLNGAVTVRTRRLFLLSGGLDRAGAERLAREILAEFACV